MKIQHLFIAAAFAFSALHVSAQDNPEKTVTKDRYNNWSPDSLKYQEMPQPLTLSKIYPAIGEYSVAEKDDAPVIPISISLNEEKKGFIWIDGLPQGRIEAYLRQGPSFYKIPEQVSSDSVKITEGVLLYDSTANEVAVCIGCTYNNEDPYGGIQPVQETEETAPNVKATKSKKAAPAKKATKKVIYKGGKLHEQIETPPPVITREELN